MGYNMFETLTSSHSDALDEILKARHTVRKFSTIIPDKEDIEQIIRAGLIAPFASFPAMGKTDFRKFFIIPSTSHMMKKVENITNNRTPKFVARMEKEAGQVPFVQTIKKTGHIAITQLLSGAPYLIIAGERKGIPPIAAESLSYCMQTMWLKATSLKIGFRPVTFILHLKLGDDREFCQLLGIPCGEYALDGCALGYPAEDYRSRHVNYPDFDSNVIWLE